MSMDLIRRFFSIETLLNLQFEMYCKSVYTMSQNGTKLWRMTNVCMSLYIYMHASMYFEGFRPEWNILTKYHCKDIYHSGW